MAIAESERISRISDNCKIVSRLAKRRKKRSEKATSKNPNNFFFRLFARFLS